jgi:hypothetical protein
MKHRKNPLEVVLAASFSILWLEHLEVLRSLDGEIGVMVLLSNSSLLLGQLQAEGPIRDNALAILQAVSFFFLRLKVPRFPKGVPGMMVLLSNSSLLSCLGSSRYKGKCRGNLLAAACIQWAFSHSTVEPFHPSTQSRYVLLRRLAASTRETLQFLDPTGPCKCPLQKT